MVLVGPSWDFAEDLDYFPNILLHAYEAAAFGQHLNAHGVSVSGDDTVQC